MNTYSLSPSRIAEFRRQTIARTTFIFVLALFIVIAINLRQPSDNWITTLIAYGFVTVLFVWNAYRNLRQNEAIWESIRVELGDDYIARSQLRIPQLRINRSEVTSVERMADGLCVRTADKMRTLAIPSGLADDGDQVIESRLAQWAPIRPVPTGNRVRFFALAGALMLGMGVAFLSPWLWLGLLAMIPVVGFTWYLVWVFYRTRGVDPKYRRSFLLTAVFLTFFAALRIVVLLAPPR